MSATVTGIHAVLAVLRKNPGTIVAVHTDRARNDSRLTEIRSLAKRAGVTVHASSRKELSERYAGGVHQGVVAELASGPGSERGDQNQLSVENLTASEHPLILILDGVQDPHNLGACLRSADAAGVSAVVVPKDGACGLTDTVRRAAAGAAESVPIITVSNIARCIEALQKKQYWVFGADGDADQAYDQVNYTHGTVIISGAEGRGLRRLTRELCDQTVSIPLQGSVESLNVSVATAIILFEVQRQWRGSPTKR